MKIVENKKTSITGDGSGGKRIEFKYSDFFKLCINNPGDKGFTIVEMKQRLKVLEAIEKEKSGKISFEDADFVLLKQALNTFPWAQVHKDIAGMSDYLDSLS